MVGLTVLEDFGIESSEEYFENLEPKCLQNEQQESFLSSEGSALELVVVVVVVVKVGVLFPESLPDLDYGDVVVNYVID